MRPAIPRIVDLEDAGYLTSTTALEVTELRAAATKGAFSLTVGLARPGTYRFTARTQAGRKLDAGASAPVTVHVSG